MDAEHAPEERLVAPNPVGNAQRARRCLAAASHAALPLEVGGLSVHSFLCAQTQTRLLALAVAWYVYLVGLAWVRES